MSFESWLAFVAVWSVAMIGIGTNVLICINAGATNGFMRGLWIALGLTLASVAHVVLAGLGLSIVILAWSGAFTVLKWAGVAYLTYLGIRLWTKKPDLDMRQGRHQQGRFELFKEGIVVNLTNPQAYVWYLVFLTPFISAEAPLSPQIATLALTVMGINAVAYAVYVLMGTPFRRYLTSAYRVKMFNRISASIMFALASLLAVAPNHRPIK